MSLVAVVYYAIDDINEVESMYKYIIKEIEDTLRLRHPKALDMLDCLGRLLYRVSKLEKVKVKLKRRLTIDIFSLETSVYRNLAESLERLLLASGRVEEARELCGGAFDGHSTV